MRWCLINSDRKLYNDFGMCLGEGTGAIIGMNLLEASVKIYSEMATFQNAGVSNKNADAG